ncbi:Coenzyme F420 hydrogenase/dehydrogenase, beta subunit C-terminal domain [Roseibium album]|uniref:Coenzyme F420-reducing hydrogenase subunit beta n=1 Tax=Roseibium album TaxID=311410 RepID=A0A0M6ZBU4_9HYPH|nr:Coenzyme F420 hydrogenase/dehydrogenase, beta subunit C-terminal domain [Roseibium album]CTQ60229.1 coenzyme F420-reducing hydrogenase subunit beta [Roseibium album]CTQ66835.1 coenzyme F420-reducing hydrogenase subunit beta [Roseibium album]CTQ74595.1 coenzyme F420-reducing hydrogenase subunit beta [Roseibium album]
MIDVDHLGVRPEFSENVSPASVKEAMSACPTVSSDFGILRRRDDYEPAVDSKTEAAWGAITGIWEGHAGDDEIRFKGSSGGALTAISQYCLEVLEMHGVLHTGQNRDDPIRNKSRLSRSREELLEVVGSRYSPASVCDGLEMVETAPKPCVVIGKPVEIAATRNAMNLRPALEKNVGLTLSFFCAETPPTKATRSLLEKLGVSEGALKSLRYRGYGWPGYFVTQCASEEPKQHWIYDKTWAYLQQYRPWAVHQWPDGSGELADISCGDPWYEEPDGENPGFSLLVARTRLGREIIEGAIEHGYLTATPAEVWKLEKSQAGLLRKKGAVWGRRQMHRVMGMPNAKFKDVDLFSIWLDLPFRTKVRSTLGTLQRIWRRRLWKLP